MVRRREAHGIEEEGRYEMWGNRGEQGVAEFGWIWRRPAVAGMAAGGGSRKGEKEWVGKLKLQRAFSVGWHSGRLASL
jgi:hypothetical protein